MHRRVRDKRSVDELTGHRMLLTNADTCRNSQSGLSGVSKRKRSKVNAAGRRNQHQLDSGDKVRGLLDVSYRDLEVVMDCECSPVNPA
jgi:hypothetical protein